MLESIPHPLKEAFSYTPEEILEAAESIFELMQEDEQFRAELEDIVLLDEHKRIIENTRICIGIDSLRTVLENEDIDEELAQRFITTASGCSALLLSSSKLSYPIIFSDGSKDEITIPINVSHELVHLILKLLGLDSGVSAYTIKMFMDEVVLKLSTLLLSASTLYLFIGIDFKKLTDKGTLILLIACLTALWSSVKLGVGLEHLYSYVTDRDEVLARKVSRKHREIFLGK